MHTIPGLHDPVSSLTHLLGAAGFVALTWILLRRARRLCSRPFLVTYCACCISLLFISGVYHSLAPGPARDAMLQADLAAIFALIAGTFTAIHGVLFTGANRWVPICLVWSIGAVGMVLALFFFESVPSLSWHALYLGQGWFGLFSTVLIWRQYGPSYVVLPFLGGTTFTVGSLIEANDRIVLLPHIVGAHELFHVIVLLGMSFFWVFIYDLVAARAPVATSQPVAKPVPVVPAHQIAPAASEAV